MKIQTIIYIIIFVITVMIGLFLKFQRPQQGQTPKFFHGMNTSLIKNFAGNEILCQSFTFLLYALLTSKSFATIFISGMAMSYLALALHIRDVTGKSLESIFDKISFSGKNIRDNMFVRITLILIIVFFILFVASVAIEKIVA